MYFVEMKDVVWFSHQEHRKPEMRGSAGSQESHVRPSVSTGVSAARDADRSAASPGPDTNREDAIRPPRIARQSLKGNPVPSRSRLQKHSLTAFLLTSRIWGGDGFAFFSGNAFSSPSPFITVLSVAKITMDDSQPTADSKVNRVLLLHGPGDLRLVSLDSYSLIKSFQNKTQDI